MKDIAVQLRDNVLVPYSEKDLESLKEYKQNQILRAKITGAEKPRSYEQLKMYWALCKVVADNMEDMTPEDVDFEVKIKVAKHHPSMIRRFRSVDGAVFMEPISIAYSNMKHLEACKFFDLSWPIMAKMIDVSPEELLQNANN